MKEAAGWISRHLHFRYEGSGWLDITICIYRRLRTAERCKKEDTDGTEAAKAAPFGAFA